MTNKDDKPGKDEDSAQKGKGPARSKQPPKIKLSGLNGKASSPISNSIPSKAEPPPKLKVEQDNNYGDTARIDLPPDAAAGDTGIKEQDKSLEDLAKSSTIRIDANLTDDGSDIGSSTSKIDLSGAADQGSGTQAIDLNEVAKDATTRIDLPPGVGVTGQINDQASPEELAEAAKNATIRIDMPNDAAAVEDSKSKTAPMEAVAEGGSPSDTSAIKQELSPEELNELNKKSTIRIDADATTEDPTKVKDDALDAAKAATARVSLEDEGEGEDKGDTARLDTASILKHEAAEASKKRTARIEMSEVLDGEEEKDIFKRRTALMGPAKTDGEDSPRTVKVSRSGSPNPTIPRGKRGRRGTSDTEKSDTARIDLPSEGSGEPPTKPKTIRIKRSDGSSASRVLAISQPGDTGRMGDAAYSDEEETGTLWSVLSLVAVLVAAVLVYVLIAQTMAPGLPFPNGM